MQLRSRGSRCTPLDSTLNMTSNGGMPAWNCDTSDVVIVLADHRSLLAECPSLMTNFATPRTERDRRALEPASFMWNGLWSKFHKGRSCPTVASASVRARMTFIQVLRSRSFKTARGTGHFRLGRRKLTENSCFHVCNQLLSMIGRFDGPPRCKQANA